MDLAPYEWEKIIRCCEILADAIKSRPPVVVINSGPAVPEITSIESLDDAITVLDLVPEEVWPKLKNLDNEIYALYSETVRMHYPRIKEQLQMAGLPHHIADILARIALVCLFSGDRKIKR